MKCYIATFCRYENYGTRLQNYALCHAIKQLGGEPISISINNTKTKIERVLKDIFARCPIVCDKQKVWLNNTRKRAAFKAFNAGLNVKEYTYKQLYEIDFSEAIAIAGSDQIWSPAHMKRFPREREFYFLQFVPGNKRFTYAPSFGSDTIPEDMIEMYRNYLGQFKNITVREMKGQEIVYELTGKKAQLLPDPVFLLSREEWRRRSAKIERCSKNKYIVLYFLGIQNRDIIENIMEYSKKNNYESVYISGNFYQEQDITPSPDEFVGLIDGAEMVLTDSFHASAFSIIMETPFRVFRRKDVEQFSRIETLLNKYNYLDAIIESVEQLDCLPDNMEHNVRSVNSVLENEKKVGMEYLKNLLHK